MTRWRQLVCLVTLGLAGDLSAQPPPNILLIVTDDQGYGDLSLHGNTAVETPHLDRLGRESMRFDNFHATSVCATTRASLLTGKNHYQVGVWGVHISRDYLHLDELTLADYLQAAGYHTGFIGKWHSGRAPAWMPWNRGFDDAWVASLYKHVDTPVSRNGKAMQLDGLADDTFTELAIDFMRENRDQPFSLMLSYMSIHTPLEAPQELVRKYKARGQSEYFAELNAMLEHLDANIGKLMGYLDRSGLRENTIVVFISDNGPVHRSRATNRKLSRDEIQLRSPQNLRGSKGHIWQNALRVPCFISWPKKIQPSQIEAFTDVTDLFPTLLQIARVPEAEEIEGVTGRSLVPFLAGRQTRWPDNREFYRPGWQVSLNGYMRQNNVLVDKNDLLYEPQIGAWRNGPFKLVKTAKNEFFLYNLEDDPREREDILSEHPEMAKSMQKKLQDAFEQTVAYPTSFEHPRFHIGHLEYDRYERVGRNLSGSEIPFGGGVRMTGGLRADIHGSLNWKNPGDSQTVPVEVVTPGRYKVTIEAEEPVENAEFLLTVGDSEIRSPLRQIGGKWTLGEVDLEVGEHDLTLELVSNAPGENRPFKELELIVFTNQS
ncbi:MAG: sulfatase-like hydrolase/transferase [Verrucomicrobiota bacterium]